MVSKGVTIGSLSLFCALPQTQEKFVTVPLCDVGLDLYTEPCILCSQLLRQQHTSDYEELMSGFICILLSPGALILSLVILHRIRIFWNPTLFSAIHIKQGLEKNRDINLLRKPYFQPTERNELFYLSFHSSKLITGP